jgi:hypothetical protein
MRRQDFSRQLQARSLYVERMYRDNVDIHGLEIEAEKQAVRLNDDTSPDAPLKWDMVSGQMATDCPRKGWELLNWQVHHLEQRLDLLGFRIQPNRWETLK